MGQECPNNTADAAETYANLNDLSRECVDFVSSLTGPVRTIVRGYLSLLGQTGLADTTFDAVDMELLRLIAENTSAKVEELQATRTVRS